MRIDLFDFIEGLFKGFVYFFYNLAETMFLLLRRPVRGALILTLRARSTRRRQIGSLTFLFCLYFALACTGLWGFGSDSAANDASRYLASGAGLKVIWTASVIALIAAVIIDAALRLYLRTVMPDKRRRRDLVLSATEFSLIWPALAFPLLGLSGAAIANAYPKLMGFMWQFGLTIWMLSGIFLSSFPAARILGRGLRRSIRGRRRQGSLSGPGGPALLSWHMFLLGGVTAGAVIAANLLVQRALAYDRKIEDAGRPFQIVHVECVRYGTRLEVSLVLENLGPRREIAVAEQFTVHLQGDEDEAGKALRGKASLEPILESGALPRRSVIAEPGATVTAGPWRAELDAPLASAATDCRVTSPVTPKESPDFATWSDVVAAPAAPAPADEPPPPPR